VWGISSLPRAAAPRPSPEEKRVWKWINALVHFRRLNCDSARQCFAGSTKECLIEKRFVYCWKCNCDPARYFHSVDLSFLLHSKSTSWIHIKMIRKNYQTHKANYLKRNIFMMLVVTWFESKPQKLLFTLSATTCVLHLSFYPSKRNAQQGKHCTTNITTDLHSSVSALALPLWTCLRLINPGSGEPRRALLLLAWKHYSQMSRE